MSPVTETQFLKAIPAFADLDESLLERIVAHGRIDDVAAETVLFQQGQMPEFLFVLLRGMVALTSTAEGSSTTVEILKPVEQFQLSPVLLQAPYLLSAQALQPSRVFRVRADTVRRIVESEPDLALAAARHLSTQYRHVVGEVLGLKLRSVTQRLARYLLSLQADAVERCEVRLPYGKRHLAARLGASPEHLSRAFAALREHGVTTRGSWVTVSDPERLSLLAALRSPQLTRGGTAGQDRARLS